MSIYNVIFGAYTVVNTFLFILKKHIANSCFYIAMILLFAMLSIFKPIIILINGFRLYEIITKSKAHASRAG